MNTKVQLNEYLHPEMDILFVALNAPDKSNKNAHWFSGNLSFWNVLFNAGIITQPIKDVLEGDIKVFGSTEINFNNLQFGVVDLVQDIVQTDSSKIKTKDEHVQRILSIVDKHPTKKLCLMHSKVGKQFQKSGIIKRNIISRNNSYGLVGIYNETEIYEVPFHNV